MLLRNNHAVTGDGDVADVVAVAGAVTVVTFVAVVAFVNDGAVDTVTAVVAVMISSLV